MRLTAFQTSYIGLIFFETYFFDISFLIWWLFLNNWYKRGFINPTMNGENIKFVLKISSFEMNFIILLAIVQSSIAGRNLKRFLPAQAQLPNIPYGKDAGNNFWHAFKEFEKVLDIHTHELRLQRLAQWSRMPSINLIRKMTLSQLSCPQWIKPIGFWTMGFKVFSWYWWNIINSLVARSFQKPSAQKTFTFSP